MASAQKTANLGLNLWQGADVPKMADFNSDNTLIDAAVGTHRANSAIHLSQADRALLTAPFATGSYVGNAAEERAVNVGFKPRAGVIFAADAFLCEYGRDINTTICGMGFLTATGGSIGVTPTATGFRVLSIEGGGAVLSMPVLNRRNVTYHYILWK